MPLPADTIESLARALYAVSAMRRDLQRLAGLEHAISGLTALGAVQRLGPVRVSDVAAELQVNLSVASRQVQGLEDEGLIVRVPDPSDGRSSLVELSERGCERLAAVHVRMTGALQSALADWDPVDLRSLADGLVRLRADLAAPLAPGAVPVALPRASAGSAGVPAAGVASAVGPTPPSGIDDAALSATAAPAAPDARPGQIEETLR